ncbi:MAG: phosphoribosylanthranilate isomerase [Saprospiraceae bacterium]
MKIKVCGLREPDNISAISALRPAMMGFIFAEESPRAVKGDELKNWLEKNEQTLEGIARVGVFVNAEVDQMLNAVHDYGLDYVQLHGEESPGYCAELQLLWSVSSMRKAKMIKAFGVDDRFDFDRTHPYAQTCSHFIFDTKTENASGGTGRRWAWDRLNEYHGVTPFLLSGGIGPEDAAEVRAVGHPQLAGVDINSKFEIKAGVKDVEAVRRFMEMVG